MTNRLEVLTVELGAEEAAWLRQRAAETGTSLSGVLTEALRSQRRLAARGHPFAESGDACAVEGELAEPRVREQSAAMERLLTELGTDDITEEDLAAVRAEWRG